MVNSVGNFGYSLASLKIVIADPSLRYTSPVAGTFTLTEPVPLRTTRTTQPCTEHCATLKMLRLNVFLMKWGPGLFLVLLLLLLLLSVFVFQQQDPYKRLSKQNAF